jgi:hypothetical protein
LLEVVATDLRDGNAQPGLVRGYFTGRGRFDTPFYNGGGKGVIDIYPSTQNIIIEGYGEWGRSEINYFAQGMWSAESGESLEWALGLTEQWNRNQYGDEVPEKVLAGKMHWTEFGYTWYKKWNAPIMD